MNNLRSQSRLEQTAIKNVYGRNCLEIGGVWIDEGFDAKMKTVTVKAMSKAYFRILERHPEAREALRIGRRVYGPGRLVAFTELGLYRVLYALRDSAELRALLEDGVAKLDAAATERFGVRGGYVALNWERDRLPLVQAVTGTPFFQKLRSDLVVSFYNQPELWRRFGYEGSSWEEGGYIERGFNDLDWLGG
jgi:hypothetical protein